MSQLPTRGSKDGTGTDLYYASSTGMFDPKPIEEVEDDREKKVLETRSEQSVEQGEEQQSRGAPLHVGLAMIGAHEDGYTERDHEDRQMREAEKISVPAETEKIQDPETEKQPAEQKPEVEPEEKEEPVISVFRIKPVGLFSVKEVEKPAQAAAESAEETRKEKSEARPSVSKAAPPPVTKEEIKKQPEPAAEKPVPARAASSEKRNAPEAVKNHEKLRIAFVTWDTLGWGRGGQAPEYFENMARNLVELDHEVHIFTRWFEGEDRLKKQNGITYHRSPHTLDENLVTEATNFAQNMVREIENTEEKNGPFDVVQTCDWRSAPVLDHAGKKDTLAVAAFYDTEEIRAWGKIEGQSAEIQSIEQKAAKNADRLLAVNKMTREKLEKLAPERNIAEISRPINEIGGKMPDAGEVKQRYGIGPLEPTILFAGELCLATGPDLLMKSLPDILKNRGDVKVIFVGDGEMLWPLKVMSRYMLLDHAVRIIGHVEEREFREIMSAADVVVLPTRNTDDTPTVLAAWQSAKPVVVTQNSPSDVEHEVNGLRVYDCENSIVWGVSRILEDFELGRKLGKNGLSETSGFSRSNVARKMEAVYYSNEPLRDNSNLQSQ